MPSGFVIREFFPDIIGERANAMSIEEIPRH
jgi:hypothetical protein